MITNDIRAVWGCSLRRHSIVFARGCILLHALPGMLRETNGINFMLRTLYMSHESYVTPGAHSLDAESANNTKRRQNATTSNIEKNNAFCCLRAKDVTGKFTLQKTPVRLCICPVQRVYYEPWFA